MDRKSFLKSLVTIGAAVPCFSILSKADNGKCADGQCMSDAGAVRQFLSDFLRNEEKNLDRTTLVKLMQERGRACCRNLKFRQDLIDQSAGNRRQTGGTYGQDRRARELYARRKHDLSCVSGNEMRLRLES